MWLALQPLENDLNQNTSNDVASMQSKTSTPAFTADAAVTAAAALATGMSTGVASGLSSTPVMPGMGVVLPHTSSIPLSMGASNLTSSSMTLPSSSLSSTSHGLSSLGVNSLSNQSPDFGMLSGFTSHTPHPFLANHNLVNNLPLGLQNGNISAQAPQTLPPALGNLFAPHVLSQNHASGHLSTQPASSQSQLIPNLSAIPSSGTTHATNGSPSIDSLTSLANSISHLNQTSFPISTGLLAGLHPQLLSVPNTVSGNSPASSSMASASLSARSNETEDQKRRRLEKSKLQSRETRRRNKAKMQYLEERVAVLEAENNFLRMQVARLEEEAVMKVAIHENGKPEPSFSSSSSSLSASHSSEEVFLGQKRTFDENSGKYESIQALTGDSTTGKLCRVTRDEAEEWGEIPKDVSHTLDAAASSDLTSEYSLNDESLQHPHNKGKSSSASLSPTASSASSSYNLISFTQARCSQLLSRVDALLEDDNPKHMAAFVDEYIDQVAVYGRSRQAAINYCLNQILNLLHLNSDTRFIFWAAMQRKVWQNRRNGIFKMFIDSIQLSDKQIQQLVTNSDRVHDILLEWRKTGELFKEVHETLKETSERVHNLIRKELLPLLTPRQVILYLRWIEMNPAVSEMIKTLVPAFDIQPLNAPSDSDDSEANDFTAVSNVCSGEQLSSQQAKNELKFSSKTIGPVESFRPNLSTAPGFMQQARPETSAINTASFSTNNIMSQNLSTLNARSSGENSQLGTGTIPSIPEVKDLYMASTPQQLPAYLSAFAGNLKADEVARIVSSLPFGTGIAQAYEALIEHTDPAAAAATRRMKSAAAACTTQGLIANQGDEDEEDDDEEDDD